MEIWDLGYNKITITIILSSYVGGKVLCVTSEAVAKLHCIHVLFCWKVPEDVNDKPTTTSMEAAAWQDGELLSVGVFVLYDVPSGCCNNVLLPLKIKSLANIWITNSITGLFHL